MTTTAVPQDEGRLSPREAKAWQAATEIDAPNRASDKRVCEEATKFAQNVVREWSDQMRALFRRWRVTLYMLAGNTLDRSGPEDIHVPELYKAVETLVPRIEEAIVERDPWFKIISRKPRDRRTAETVAAYMDWLFDQARIRETIQPAARNMLVCQSAVWYTRWETRVQRVTVRTERKEWKDGHLRRYVDKKVEDHVTYFGPKAHLVDPFDFIIDPKSTNAQDAVYVGHRSWMTIDDIRRLGKQYGWVNLGEELDAIGGARSDYQTRYYSWPRDPTSLTMLEDLQNRHTDGRPGKIEVTILYSRYDIDGTGDYRDYQFVISGGKVIHEVRLNQHDNERRPYAIARATNNGHEFHGIGPLDNAVRLNQHLDRYHQIFLRSAEVAACPMVFAEEDSDLPDSLYKVQPFSVFKGTGPVRFSSVPDGTLQAAPMVLGTLQRNIEETVGAFRIQMGQDQTGGTATEASLSLQEGNRRTRGLIRGLAGGLEQLLECFYHLTRQHSIADVEFPVLGKRALDLKRDHVTINPADLLDDVKFDLIGLHSLRTNGLKSTGLQLFGNAMAPFIMANPQAVDQTRLMHKFATEFIGPEDADEIVKVPTKIEDLNSQEEENEGLIQGTEIDVDPDDDHKAHLEVIEPLYQRALHDEDMPVDVKGPIFLHRMQHVYALQRQQAQEAAEKKRMPQQEELPPEAGGQVGPSGQSPKAGGMSDAMSQLAGSPGGQTPGETPGPRDGSKQPRPGGAGRPMSQSDNM